MNHAEKVKTLVAELLEESSHNGNRQAARKMASLRVAAELGRRMKG